MLSKPYSNRLILGIKDVTQVKTQVGILEVKSTSPKHTHSYGKSQSRAAMPTNDATDPTLTGGGKAYPTSPKSTEPVSPHARFPRTMTLSWARKIERV